MNRTVLLIFALLGACGFGLAYKWDDLRVMLGVEHSPEERAVQLAKAGFSLDRSETNEAVIRSRLQTTGGATDVIGWRGEAKTPPFYLVTFRYREDGEEWTYYFEVNIDTAVVCDAGADPALIEKYGIPLGRIR